MAKEATRNTKVDSRHQWPILRGVFLYTPTGEEDHFAGRTLPDEVFRQYCPLPALVAGAAFCSRASAVGTAQHSSSVKLEIGYCRRVK